MVLVVLLVRPMLQFADVAIRHNALMPGATNLVRWQSHWHVIRQSWPFFQNDFAGRIANRLDEELALLRGQAANFGTPVFNTLQEYKDIPLTSMPFGHTPANGSAGSRRRCAWLIATRRRSRTRRAMRRSEASMPPSTIGKYPGPMRALDPIARQLGGLPHAWGVTGAVGVS